jgi:hypothetical protein
MTLILLNGSSYCVIHIPLRVRVDAFNPEPKATVVVGDWMCRGRRLRLEG